MKNGIYFIVIALLVAKLFKILIYANLDDLWRHFVDRELKLNRVVTLITKFHDMSTVTFPWQQNRLQALSIQRGKSEFSSIKKCYLILLFIQWVWANTDITQHKQKKVC